MFFDGMNGSAADLRAKFNEYLAALASDDDSLPEKQRIRRLRRRIARQNEIIQRLANALGARNSLLKNSYDEPTRKSDSA